MATKQSKYESATMYDRMLFIVIENAKIFAAEVLIRFIYLNKDYIELLSVSGIIIGLSEEIRKNEVRHDAYDTRLKRLEYFVRRTNILSIAIESARDKMATIHRPCSGWIYLPSRGTR